MTKEELLNKLKHRKYIYAYMYINNETHKPGININNDIIKIPVRNLDITNRSLFYVLGWPGPDYNHYLLEDFNVTWAFNPNDLEGTYRE